MEICAARSSTREVRSSTCSGGSVPQPNETTDEGAAPDVNAAPRCGWSQSSEAVEAALGARRQWEAVPLNEKIDVFLKAGDLAAGPYRPRLMAATMLGQGKTVFQAEIDAAAELADFFR